MSQEYFYNGHLRWTLFWENPNCWAAFLACVLAWVWGGQDALRAKFQITKSQIPKKSQITNNKIPKQTSSTLGLVALYIVEAGGWFLLVKTYSRGGLVAAGVAMVVFFGLRGTGREVAQTAKSAAGKFFKSRLGSLRYVAIRIAFVAALCLTVGFASRMSPDYVAQDRSVLNRFDLWKGALVMISDSPFHGWGYTLGGMMYQNWYQPLSHATRPIGFVNSYLEVAVEQGSQVLFLVVVCACALLLVVVRFRRVTWVAAAGASLVAWFVCNLWSSLWVWGGLWVLPGAAVLCILAKVVDFEIPNSKIPNSKEIPNSKTPNSKKYDLRPPFAVLCATCDFLRLMIVSLFVGIVVWVGIVGAGRVFAKGFAFQARPVACGDAAIVARRGARVGTQELRSEIWVDAAVTGRYWGKTLRTILGDGDCGRFIVYAPWALRGNRVELPAGRVVYLGFQAELLSDMGGGGETIIILHPTVWPPAAPRTAGDERGGLGETALPSVACNITVCLPAFDVSAYNLPWRRWAAENGAKLVFSPQGGIRIDAEQNREFWRELLFNEQL